MSKKIGIYKITNNLNGKCYIGQSKNITKRFYTHKNSRKKNMAISDAIFTVGVENFSFEILILCSETELDEYEIRFINENNSLVPNGYNIRTGGSANYKVTDTSNLMKSAKCRNNKGSNNPFYGKTHSLETRNIISLANKGKTISDEHKVIMSENGKRNVVYLIERSKNNNPFKGKEHSAESKLKISLARLGDKNPMCRQVCIDDVIYFSKRHAAEVLKCSPNTITNRCKNQNFPNYKEL